MFLTCYVHERSLVVTSFDMFSKPNKNSGICLLLKVFKSFDGEKKKKRTLKKRKGANSLQKKKEFLHENLFK